MMIKMSALRTDPNVRTDGEWVSLGVAFELIEVRTRPLTDAYSDAQTKEIRKAARRYNGQVNDVPNAEIRKIRHQAMVDHVWLEVRGIADDDGNPMDSRAFFMQLIEPGCELLFDAAFLAAVNAGQTRLDDVDSAKGN